MYTVRDRCALCHSRDLQFIWSAGEVPLSNGLLDSALDKVDKYPLTLVFCPECSLLQIREVVDPNILFKNYVYFSSQSKTMVEHARDLAEKLIVEQNLNEKSMVIEPASNDGYLLQHFKNKGIPVLGVEPASNIAEIARQNGIDTVDDFFGEKLALSLPKADVILGLNVLGHVADLVGFVRGIRIALKEDGVAIIEVPYVRDMVEDLAWDTIYFEHLYYYSIAALDNLFKWNGMMVTKVERTPIHCGSIRVYVKHISSKNAMIWDKETEHLRFIEDKLGVGHASYYVLFGMNSQRTASDIHTYIETLHRGNRIMGYGAAAKGTMLLNGCGIGSNFLDGVVDSTPAKIGKYIPGTGLKIVPPEELGKPDYILLLARNFKNEIMNKHAGMSWVEPLPFIQVIRG